MSQQNGSRGDTPPFRPEAFLHTDVFLASRVLAYALLAALAGAIGVGLAKALVGNLGNAVIGGVSIVAGLWLLRRPAASCGGVSPRLTFPGRNRCASSAAATPCRRSSSAPRCR